MRDYNGPIFVASIGFAFYCMLLVRRVGTRMSSRTSLNSPGASAAAPLRILLAPNEIPGHWNAHSRIIGALALILALTLTACGTTSTAGPAPTATTIVAVEGDFLGTVSGLNAGIAITTDGTNALIYIGDGTPTHISVSQWLQTPVANDIIALTSPTNFNVSALLTPETATGTITRASTNQTYTFSANAVTSRGVAGVYQSTENIAGVDYLGGWYVLPTTVTPGATAAEGGGIVNQQTSVLITSPTPDFANKTVTVPGLGTFALTYCHYGRCS